jgi:O-antigen ligase
MISAQKLPFSFWFFALGFFTCTWDLLLTVSAGGFHFKAHQGFFLLAFLFALREVGRAGFADFFRPLSRPFSRFMLFLLLYYACTTIESAFPLKSALYCVWFGFQLGCLWLTAQYLARAGMIQALIRVAWATLLFLSAVILIDHVAYRFGYIGGFIGNNQDIILRWGTSRPHAFSSEPSYAAAFLALGVLTLAGHVISFSRKKGLAGLGTLLILTALAITTSRTGWISLGLGVALLVAIPLCFGRKLPLRKIALASAVGALAMLAFFFSTPASQRSALHQKFVSSLFSGQDGSGNARLRAYREAWKMAQETHWIGTGLGASYRYYIQHGGVDPTDLNAMAIKHYGNEIIMSTWGQLLAEGGLPAILLFVLAGWALLRELLRRWKENYSALALGSLVAALVWFGFSAWWLGNICRGDIWVWYGLWGAVAAGVAARPRES